MLFKKTIKDIFQEISRNVTQKKVTLEKNMRIKDISERLIVDLRNLIYFYLGLLLNYIFHLIKSLLRIKKSFYNI